MVGGLQAFWALLKGVLLLQEKFPQWPEQAMPAGMMVQGMVMT